MSHTSDPDEDDNLDHTLAPQPLHYVEQALLGALLLDPRRLDDVSGIAAESFSTAAHSSLYAAISTLPQGYAQNIPSVASWRQAVLAGRLPVARMRALSDEDRLRGAVIEQLMCNLRVDLAALAAAARMAPDLFAAALDRLDELRRHGLVGIDGWVVTVPEPGRPLLRQVCAAFDAYLAAPTPAATAPRHAAA